MKLTKANVTKLLDKHGVSKSKLYRGRITYEATEGMEYEFVNSEALVITYRRRTSSFLSLGEGAFSFLLVKRYGSP